MNTSQLFRLSKAACIAGLIAFTVGCGGGGTEKKDASSTTSGAQVTVKGSDTMVILGQKWAETYMKKVPDANIQVTGGGSGTGFAALQNSTTDIAQASRPIKDKEKTAIKSKFNKDAKEFLVARDGLTVYVNESNPVNELTMAQLKDLYTGKVKNWKDVGGPDQPVVVYGRENNSGTYAFFQEHVLSKEDFAPSVQAMPGTASVVNSVTKDKGSIGYGGFAYARGVKHLKIKKDAASAAVEPTVETIKSGAYPLSRGLFMYTVGDPKESAQKFIDYCLSGEGQKIVKEVHYIPIN